MKLNILKCFYCCCTCWKKRNTFDLERRELNILLLGMKSVGKTEVGYILAGKKRTIYETTNGVQCYKTRLPKCSLAITEVGGNRQSEKLWHHYYSRTMGLIYCYDMSIDDQQLQTSFQLLNKIVSHQFMRGKVMLLVGTKSDLVNDTIQLYDIENRFALENLANKYFMKIKTIHFNPNKLESLWNGIEWLANNININYSNLKNRIENDNDIEKTLKKQQQKSIKFSNRRAKTAPASINSSQHRRSSLIFPWNMHHTNVF
ncbi:uncharacterized protein LOC129920589 [Episyrphus balteatus]|uniref:uncharacterized protein LOC129920589 n=1 Tax=Episyrphus balteatus TaxID=286459 RepID=UPI002485C447|nr:uncharacterized protein LOC129920589 [Episyrphus balteatus]